MGIELLERSALAAHQAGNFAQARKIYHEVLSRNPGRVSALHYLAISAAVENNFSLSLRYLTKAIGIDSKNQSLQKDYATVLLKTGKPEKALAYFDRALSINPLDAELFARRGVALTELKRYPDALQSFNTSLSLQPENYEALINRAKVYEELKMFRAAVETCKSALKIQPVSYSAFFCMGNAYLKLEEFHSAIDAYNSAIHLNGESHEAWINKAAALKNLKQFDAALEIYRNLLDREPDSAELHNNIGVIYFQTNRREHALKHFRIALNQVNHKVDVELNLARCLFDYHDFSAATDLFDKAQKRDPLNVNTLQPLVFELNYSGQTTADTLKQRSIKLASVFRTLQKKSYPIIIPDMTKKKLTIGLLSGDLKNHPVGCFIENFLVHARRKSLDFILYSNNDQDDETTERLKSLEAVWKDIRDLSDAELASAIRSSNVDILIDLSGHTAFNRLGVFTCKPAPVQATWLGYCGTTGLHEIDYVIGDPFVTPVAEESHFVEKVWRMPNTYWCFTEPVEKVEVCALPAISNGYITYGCFNNAKKINNRVIGTWANILRINHQAKLFLKSIHYEDDDLRRHFIERFSALGIGSDRIIFEGKSSRPDYFEAYNRVDIVLDPFPFPGGTTSFEGLWMGAPFITLKGNRFYAHNGETIAHNGGLADWIAATEEEYIRKAVEYADRLNWLSDIRMGLREKVLKSPLFNAAAFAQDFEDAMWGMWRAAKS